MVLVLAEADDPESQEACLLPTDLDEAVALTMVPGSMPMMMRSDIAAPYIMV